MTLEILEIPNEDYLFYRIHRTDIRDGKIIPGAFKEREKDGQKGMSTDWDEYSSPEILLNRSVAPDDNGIVDLNVGAVREIELLEVNHSPIEENYSHTHVNGIPKGGQMKPKIRLKLLGISRWIIKIKNE